VAVPLESVFAQIDSAIARGNQLIQTSRHEDLSDHPDEVLLEARSLCAAAIERFAPPASTYARSAAVAIERHDGVIPGAAVRELMGVLRALRIAYENGYLTSVEELVHASVFADFLEMADELVSKSYKDPAAVLAGSVLEEHLRRVAGQAGVDPALPDGRFKKGAPVVCVEALDAQARSAPRISWKLRAAAAFSATRG
jgi:hypothetical protein